MTTYRITGRDLRTGRRVDARLQASDERQARKIASMKGVEVEIVALMPECAPVQVEEPKLERIPLEPPKPVAYAAAADRPGNPSARRLILASVAAVLVLSPLGLLGWLYTSGRIAAPPAQAVPGTPAMNVTGAIVQKQPAVDPCVGWSRQQLAEAESLLTKLELLQSRISVGVSYADYREDVTQAVTSIQTMERKLTSEARASELYLALHDATVTHGAAARLWLEKIEARSDSKRDAVETDLQSVWALVPAATERVRRIFRDRADR